MRCLVLKSRKAYCLSIKDSRLALQVFAFAWMNFRRIRVIDECVDILREIRNLPNDAYKILFVHWGNEYINRPSSAQKKYAHWLVDAGFDLIVGMHPHVLQGYEDYKHPRIYYSLGDFVFDMPSEACRYGAIACLDFKDNNIPTFSEKYVRIDMKGYPTVIQLL